MFVRPCHFRVNVFLCVMIFRVFVDLSVGERPTSVGVTDWEGRGW